MRPAIETISKSSAPRITATQIVCGNCAGDDLLPIRTFVTADGCCSRCGGRSFELASIICGALARYMKNGESRT
jgi:hypothetical protein